MSAPALASGAGTTQRLNLRLKATASNGNRLRSYELDAENLSAAHPVWSPISPGTLSPRVTFAATPGDTYRFRMAATDTSGDTGQFATATTVVPTGVRPSGGRYRGAWRQVKRAHAWLGRAIESSRPGAAFTLGYTGGTLSLIGERGPRGARLRVALDGRNRTISLRAGRARVDQTIATFKLSNGKHRLRLTVLSGTIAIEGYGIASRTS